MNLFRHPRVGTFFQKPPQLENPYTGDAFLQRVLKRILPREAFVEIDKDLRRFGERTRTEIEDLGLECENNPPTLVQHDAWGQRVDRVVTHSAWNQLKRISAEEGLIALGYNNSFGEYNRVHQFTKLFIFSPSSGLYSCPLAMTDGAAKTISALNLRELNPAYERLTTRDPDLFWTSGQWMTEKGGGSDVGSGTETYAVPQADGSYKLYGYKWFTSATDADMTFTLARICTEDGKAEDATPGSRGLSMFYIETRNSDSDKNQSRNNPLNNLHITRLKNKMGTKQLPTGEILLEGTRAKLVSPVGRGVLSISNMLSITRLHNSIASVSAMRRILQLSRDYSLKRQAFGHTIGKLPLHLTYLNEIELAARGGTALVMELTRLFGKAEANKNEDNSNDRDSLLVRVLTPIAKLYLGKICIGNVSEGLESFGGLGYMEDSGIPRILRDAQVTPIWEGTTNILSLDVLRAIGKSQGGVLLALWDFVQEKLGSRDGELENTIRKCLEDIKGVVEKGQLSEVVAREFSFAIADVIIGTLLLDHIQVESPHPTDVLTCKTWVKRMVPLSQRIGNLVTNPQDLSSLIFDGYQHQA